MVEGSFLGSVKPQPTGKDQTGVELLMINKVLIVSSTKVAWREIEVALACRPAHDTA
jgi:hypothetical protein